MTTDHLEAIVASVAPDELEVLEDLARSAREDREFEISTLKQHSHRSWWRKRQVVQ